MDRWRTRLERMGEIVSGYRHEDVIIQAPPAEYDYVKSQSYRDRDIDLENIRRTINNIFIDNLSRANRNGTKSVAGRDLGPSMLAAARRLSSDACCNCGELGRRRNDCPKPQRHKQQQLPKQNTTSVGTTTTPSAENRRSFSSRQGQST